jgi:hypothetical protein
VTTDGLQGSTVFETNLSEYSLRPDSKTLWHLTQQHALQLVGKQFAITAVEGATITDQTLYELVSQVSLKAEAAAQETFDTALGHHLDCLKVTADMVLRRLEQLEPAEPST